MSIVTGVLQKVVLRGYQHLFEGKYDPGFQGKPSDAPELVERPGIQDATLRLAHISDLHIGRHVDEKVAELQKSLYAIKPHFLIISGDLVHEPRPEYLATARTVLNDLRNICPEILVVPGNHDRHGKVDLQRWAAGLGIAGFQGYKCIIYTLSSGRFVFFFLLNSTLAQTGGWFSQEIHDIVQVRGWIDATQMRWLRGMLSYIKEHHQAEYLRGLKIAVLHHHLLPVGSESYLEEAFMALGNSNEVLGLLAEMKLDLVLHGHKHMPAVRRVEIAERGHEMLILAAGAATASTQGRGTKAEEDTAVISKQCSFFSIEIQPDAVKVRQYNYANKLGGLRKFPLIQVHPFRRLAPEFSKMEVSLVWTIDFPSTDWRVAETFSLERLTGEERSEFPYVFGSSIIAAFGNLNFKCIRSLDGADAGIAVPAQTPQPTKSTKDGEDYYTFTVPLKLDPSLAMGLKKDKITIEYLWPRGFYEFEGANHVDGLWYYDWHVDWLRFTVRLAGGRVLKKFAVLVPGQKKFVTGQPEQSGSGPGLYCDIYDLPAGSQLTYVIERE